MADVAGEAWPDFVYAEPPNAGENAAMLASGAIRRMKITVRVERA